MNTQQLKELMQRIHSATKGCFPILSPGDFAAVSAYIRELELERDELCQTLQATQDELARRDAAAGQPDGYIFCHPSGKNFWSVSHDDTAGHNGVKPFYFAAPTAVLPPEITWIDLCEKNPEMFMGDAIIRAASYNQAISDAKELGAQPQMVALSTSEPDIGGGDW